MKKIALLLAVSMLLSFTGCGKKAPEGYVYDKKGNIKVDTTKLDYTCGDEVKWSYDESTKTLTFSGKGAIAKPENFKPYQIFAEKVIIGDEIVSIAPSSFERFAKIENVQFGNSIVEIGEKAFYGCDLIESVTIPQSIERIGKEAFALCNQLYSVSIPKNDKYFEIKSRVFAECNQLNTAIIPPTITYISPDAFLNCPNMAIYCVEGSFAYDYAKTELIPVQSYKFD